MNLHIKYFGLLAEVTSCHEEQFQFSGTTVADLLKALCVKYPALKNKSFKVAQQHNLVPEETTISNDEIVLLPPFAGG